MRRAFLAVPILLALAVIALWLGQSSQGAPAFAAPPIPGGVRVFVTFTPDFDHDGSVRDQQDEELLEDAFVLDHSGRIHERYRITDAVAVEVQLNELLGLASDPRVVRVEPDGEVFAFDAELDAAWGVKRIGSGAAHDAGRTGAGVKVAVIDTGINTTHVELDAGYDSSCSHDFVNNDDDPTDDNGHGSHVSGTIAGEDNNAGVVGVAPGAAICSYKVLSAQGGGSWSNVIAALDQAVQDGARVANLSLGSCAPPPAVSCGSGPGSTVEQAFTNAYNSGLLIVASAGNSGTCAGTSDSVGYPARWTSTIAVAATDSNDVAACFSSAGPEVELSGPGVNITSAWKGSDTGYVGASGTSMASPHVTGVAALLFGCNPSLTNVEARDILDSTAADLDSPLAAGFPDGRDTWYGYGLVQVQAALNAGCGAAPTATPTDTPAPVDTPPPGDSPTPADTATPTDTPTPTGTPTPTDTPEPTGTPTATPTAADPILYFSLASNGTVGGLSVTNEDIAGWNGASFSLYFDGSDVGLANFTIDAFSIVSPTELLLSFTNAGTVPGIASTVDDSDIVKFSTTSGSFSLYFDGSDVGLSSSSEDIDAIELLSNGHLLVSTEGSFGVPGASGADEDIIDFTVGTLGAATTGTWSLYFDGSDVALSASTEDIDGLALNGAGQIYLSTGGSFSVLGLSGADEDVFAFTPTSLGAVTAGSFGPGLVFDGSAFGLGSNDIFAIELP